MKIRSRVAIGLVALTMFAACAKQPENIAAVEVNSEAYAGYSCRQLVNEKTKISQDLANLSAEQRDAAAGDAVGVFLLGLPLASMTGSDKETLIAVAKGKIQAIDRYYAAKRCG